MNSQALLLGIDIGTSSTRAVVIDESGAIRGAARQLTGFSPMSGAHHEQDPELFLSSSVAVIAQALLEAKARPGQVAGLAICGQMAGLCVIDAQGQAVGAYDSWLDLGCASMLERLRDHEQEIMARSGGQLLASHAAKWLSMMLNEPERYRQVSKLSTPSAYVAGRLAGLSGKQAFIDNTYLGFNNFADVQAGCWNEPLLQALGMDRERLPQIVEPWSLIGKISRASARMTGLQQGTPIFAGSGDIAATLLGSAVFEPGQLVDIAGTGSVLCALRDDFSVDRQHKTLTTLRHCVPGLYYSAGYIGGAGLTFNWLESLHRSGQSPQDLSTALKRSPPRAPLMFVPHMGGRHMPLMPHMRGAFVGLTWEHGVSDLHRAVTEATAYEYAHFLECIADTGLTLTDNGVVVVGGGACSDGFNQIKADVLGLAYRRQPSFEAGAVGAALLAGHGAGVFSDLCAVAERRHEAPMQVNTPDLQRHEVHRQRRAVYQKLLANLAPVFDDLADLPE